MNSNDFKENLLLKSEGKTKRIIKKKIIKKIIKKSSNATTPYKDDQNVYNDLSTNELTPREAQEATNNFDVTNPSRKQSDAVEVDMTNDESSLTCDAEERLQYDKPFENIVDKSIITNEEQKGIKTVDSTQYLNNLQLINLEQEKEIKETPENSGDATGKPEISVEYHSDLKIEMEQNKETRASAYQDSINANCDVYKFGDNKKIYDREENLPVKKFNIIGDIDDHNEIIEEIKINENKENSFLGNHLQEKIIYQNNKNSEMNEKCLDIKTRQDNILYTEEKSEEIKNSIKGSREDFDINLNDKGKNLNFKNSGINDFVIQDTKYGLEKIIQSKENLTENQIFQERNKQNHKEDLISEDISEEKYITNKLENIQDSKPIENKLIQKDINNCLPIIKNPDNIIDEEDKDVPTGQVNFIENKLIEDQNYKEYPYQENTPLNTTPIEIVDENAYEVNLDINSEQANGKKHNGNSQENIINIHGVQEINATEDYSNNHKSIHNDLRAMDKLEITENNSISSQINLTEIKEPIIEHKIEILSEEQSSIPITFYENTSSENKASIKQKNLIDLETINNGFSIIHNEIITGMLENAFEQMIPVTSEKNLTKTVETPINIDLLEKNSAEDIKREGETLFKKEKTEDKIITISLPDKSSELITPTVTKLVSEPEPKYSEIVLNKNLEDEDDKKKKKSNNLRRFFEKYAPWLFFSIGGVVMSYFIYRRFGKYK